MLRALPRTFVRLRAIAGLEAYRYDAWGRRTRSSSTAGLVESLYGRDGQLLYQRDARTSRRRQYVYLAGSLVAEHDRPLSGSTVTVTYQHTDALGTPVATTDAAKAVLQRSEYEPYGKLLNRPLEDGPAYTGHVSDAASSLVYMQQRYYDPRTARFWSVDPVTVDSAGGNFNRYWYANNNPYRFTDPDGRCPNAFCEFFGLQETPEALKDHSFDGAKAILSNDNKRVMQFFGTTAATGAGWATIVEAAPLIAANSTKIARVSCLTVSLFCRDPKDGEKALEFTKDPAGEVAEDLMRSNARVIDRILSQLRKAETQIPKPPPPRSIPKPEIPEPLPPPEIPKIK